MVMWSRVSCLVLRDESGVTSNDLWIHLIEVPTGAKELFQLEEG
jgi:hypothetical protein